MELQKRLLRTGFNENINTKNIEIEARRSVKNGSIASLADKLEHKFRFIMLWYVFHYINSINLLKTSVG